MQERLVEFKQQAYARGAEAHQSPKEANWTHAFFKRGADLPLAERQAQSFAYALSHEPVAIHALSRIAGMTYQGCAGSGCLELYGSTEDAARWEPFTARAAANARVGEDLPENEAFAQFFSNGAMPGHIAWDFGRMLELGVSGMLARCQAGKAETDDPKAVEFFTCVEIVLAGLLAWTKRHVEALHEAAREEEDEVRRGELEEMAAICARVPEQPAGSFREAAQTFWFQHQAVMYENPFGGNSPGRLDYYLWPYLEADLAAGRTTLDEARELITELLIKLHERIAPHDGWVEALPVGGRRPDGSSAINPLSHMIIETICELQQTHPSVYVRLPSDAPEDFVDLTVRYLIEGGNRAQVYGDDAVIEALHADGVALEDARHWTAGGCMEVSPQGCNCDLLFGGAHNVARTFEVVLNGGCLLATGERAIAHHRDLTDYESFEDLYAAFANELERELGIFMKRLDIWLASYARCRPSFLLSSMTHDCLERGRSINDGGARYTDYGLSGVGIPNVGDSLYAIKRAVFEEPRFTASEVLEALRADFRGHEQVQAYLRGLPKFGADHEEADAMTNRVLLSLIDILKAHRTPFGGHCKAVILGFVWVVSHGEQVGATPDGRHAGRPLAHGLSPQSGSAANGITGAVKSATRLSLDRVGGGGAMMWDLDPAWATPAAVKPLLQTFMARGGHIFQGNTTDVERLREAREHPDEHRDLMVRVSGYSARFTRLSDATQLEIMTRHRYNG